GERARPRVSRQARGRGGARRGARARGGGAAQGVAGCGARRRTGRARGLAVFYEWVYPLHEVPGLSALNVFRYITFRAAYAAITALLVCFVLGPPVIEWLRRVRLGQKIREEGPQSHLVKSGTPTMGGLVIVSAIVVPVLLWGNFHSRSLWLAVLATVWLGALGFLDGYLRVVKGMPK